MIEGVIFDLDGVIIDSEPLHNEKNKVLYKELGITIPDELTCSFTGSTHIRKWTTLKKMFNLNQSVDELIKMDRDMGYEFTRRNIGLMKPIDGIEGLLKDLHKNKIKTAVASCSPLDIIRLVLNSFGIEKFFDEVVSSDFVKKGKPEPDIFLYAADKLHTNPDKCIVVEDSGNGVKAAKKAKMKCLGYRNLNSGNQDLSMADMVVDSFVGLNYKKLEAM